MKRAHLVAAPLLSVLLALAANARGAEWSVDTSASSLGFSGVTQGEKFDGAFADFAAAIRFDPAVLAGSRFDVKIALASADTQNEERDESLKGSDFFDVEQFAQATYVADTFIAKGGGFEAQGTLTLRGVSKPVTLAFTWTPSADGGAKLVGTAKLNRVDFGVGSGDWEDAEMVAHEVDVNTTLVLTPAG